jgi:hypothetical protein
VNFPELPSTPHGGVVNTYVALSLRGGGQATCQVVIFFPGLMHLVAECLKATSVPAGTVLMLRKQAKDPATMSDMTHLSHTAKPSLSIPGYGGAGSLNETVGRLMGIPTGVDRGNRYRIRVCLARISHHPSQTPDFSPGAGSEADACRRIG